MKTGTKTLAGVALALAMFGAQPGAKAEDAAARVAGWRAVAPVGWALDEWKSAIERFGDIVEKLPKPAALLCDTVAKVNIVVNLQCTYWDWLAKEPGGDGAQKPSRDSDKGDDLDGPIWNGDDGKAAPGAPSSDGADLSSSRADDAPAPAGI